MLKLKISFLGGIFKERINPFSTKAVNLALENVQRSTEGFGYIEQKFSSGPHSHTESASLSVQILRPQPRLPDSIALCRGWIGLESFLHGSLENLKFKFKE